MNKLEIYQAYADKCASKLGVTDKVVIQWAGGENGCKLSKRTYAHCHTSDGKYPRGTICLSRRHFTIFGVKQWHHCIAHEVAHLAVKAAHRTPTFDRRMVSLGVANDTERRNARSARKGHHHIYGKCTIYHTQIGDLRRYRCSVCGKKEGS